MDYNQIVAAIHQKDLQQINIFLKHEMKEDLPWVSTCNIGDLTKFNFNLGWFKKQILVRSVL